MAAILLDTELLLLLLAGLTAPATIARHKRMDRKYTTQDFDLLAAFLRGYDRVVITPGVLAETSNWVKCIKEPDRSLLYATFRDSIVAFREHYRSATDIVAHGNFIRLGFTDTSLLLAAKKMALLTDDFPLYEAAMRQRSRAFSFSHLREASWN